MISYSATLEIKLVDIVLALGLILEVFFPLMGEWRWIMSMSHFPESQLLIFLSLLMSIWVALFVQD
jgi:hypothetical protein